MSDPIDPVDRIMHVMERAFDPEYGEAWTRRQIADAMALGNTHCIVSSATQDRFTPRADLTTGFVLTRRAANEEEVLLIAVTPQERRRGIGEELLTGLFESARTRGTKHLFLEMREGNPAISLYTRLGFEIIGRRKDYYRGASEGPLDAITFAKTL